MEASQTHSNGVGNVPPRSVQEFTCCHQMQLERKFFRLPPKLRLFHCALVALVDYSSQTLNQLFENCGVIQDVEHHDSGCRSSSFKQAML